MSKISILLFVVLVFFLVCCNGGRNTVPNNKNTTTNNNSGNPGERVQVIRAKKETIEGLTPEPYYIGSEEPTFIKVVTNSTQPQKVGMVYYDNEANKWVKDIWEGSGENNRVIREVTFQTPHWIISKNEDYPEFYMAYSVDEGRNWINHKIGRKALDCIEGRAPALKRKYAHLLVSLPLNPKNNLPDVAIVLQWDKLRRWQNTGDPVSADLQKLCSALKELPLDWSGASQQ